MIKKILIGIGVVFGSIAIVFLFFFFKRVIGDVGYTNQTISEITDLGSKNNSLFMEYNTTRSSLNAIVQHTYVDEMATKNDQIIELLNQEKAHIIRVRDNTLRLDKYCKGKMYSVSSVNEICFNYQKYYEQMVNVFVNDVMYVNRMIQSYQEHHDDSLKKYESLEFKDYIDYNKDGVFAGKEE